MNQNEYRSEKLATMIPIYVEILLRYPVFQSADINY